MSSLMSNETFQLELLEDDDQVTVAGFWGKKEEKLHPRDKKGRFRHNLEGISQIKLTTETSLRTDTQGR